MVAAEGDNGGGKGIERGTEGTEEIEGTRTEGTAETGTGGRGTEVEGSGERRTEKPERTAAGGEGGGGSGGRGLSVVPRTEAGNGISSGDKSEIKSEMMEGEPTEAGRGTSSGKSSERTDAATTGDDICTKGVGGDLDSTERVLVEGE